MMPNILSILAISVLSFIGWASILITLTTIKELPRFLFTASHYLLNIVVFAVLFTLYFKNFQNLSPFSTMAIAMLSLFGFEFIWWNFFYRGSLWFLNYVDWIIPAFLVASTIYLVGAVISSLK